MLQKLLNHINFCRENRYLLFLTENYAALDILKHYIRGKDHSKSEPSTTGDVQEGTISQKPFTLFGSSFPKDREYTQVYIIDFMEAIDNNSCCNTYNRFAETSTRLRFAWRLDEQLSCSTLKTSMRAYMMYWTSTTCTMEIADMLTLDFRHTESNAEYTVISSRILS